MQIVQLLIFGRAELEKHKNLILTPTKIYLESIKKLLDGKIKIHGISHITGGGMPKKIRAILPSNLSAIMRKNSFPKPKIFKIIEKTGKISQKEMYNTFNMGIGMALILPKKEVSKVEKILQGEKVFEIGYITKSRKEKVVIL